MKVLIKLFLWAREKHTESQLWSCCVIGLFCVLRFDRLKGQRDKTKFVTTISETVMKTFVFRWSEYYFLKMCFHDANHSPQEIQKAGSSRKGEQGAAEKPSSESNNSSVPLFLQYPVPYTQDAPTPLLVSQSPSKLQFGNPYSMSDSKGLFPPQKVTPTFCSVFSGSNCRIQMMDSCLNPSCLCRWWRWGVLRWSAAQATPCGPTLLGQ